MTDVVSLVLGVVLAAVVLIPMWVTESRRDARRIDDLLRLLEAKAAPAEFFAVSAPPADYDTGSWLSTEDGLIVVPAEY